MPDVTVYTRSFCPYCTRAISLLQRKGANVREIDATGCPQKRQEMVSRSGRWTFPQIFIGDVHVGALELIRRRTAPRRCRSCAKLRRRARG
jgi:glutaredoxin 3